MSESESTTRIVRYERTIWFDGFDPYERPQCPHPECKFIAERESGAWECWRHGRFEVVYPRTDGVEAEDTTEQQSLTEAI